MQFSTPVTVRSTHLPNSGSNYGAFFGPILARSKRNAFQFLTNVLPNPGASPTPSGRRIACISSRDQTTTTGTLKVVYRASSSVRIALQGPAIVPYAPRVLRSLSSPRSCHCAARGKGLAVATNNVTHTHAYSICGCYNLEMPQCTASHSRVSSHFLPGGRQFALHSGSRSPQ
jgi:hypothetical protein